MDYDAAMFRHYEPSYRMKPHDEKKFAPTVVNKICESVIKATLDGRAWNGEEETVWTVTISEQIKTAVKELDLPRYKIVVQVVLGENKSQGVRVASRCLWDTDTDNYATYRYESDSMWCVAMVFGLYTE